MLANDAACCSVASIAATIAIVARQALEANEVLPLQTILCGTH